jgi:hypothetical protein
LAHCLAFLGATRPDLASVVTAWDHLPEAVRAGTTAMIRASNADLE